MSKHEVRIVRISDILPHENADTLEIYPIWGYSCIGKKDQFKIGELAAFIEPDYVIDTTRPEFRFLSNGKSSKQRITIRKFRGIVSYGLLIPAPVGSVEGDNVMEYLGVERWEPPLQKEHAMSAGIQDIGPDIPVPVYDLENWKKYKYLIPEGEQVLYFEKVHGCNSRFVFHEGKMYAGSRTTWKKKPGEFVKTISWVDAATNTEQTKDIIAPENTWWSCLQQNPWIEAWCRNHPSMVLFGEIYGPNIQGKDFSYA
jgi:RNA ligase (TIGR02306 family)